MDIWKGPETDSRNHKESRFMWWLEKREANW